MRRIIKNFAPALPAIAAFLLLAPWLCLKVDQRLGLAFSGHLLGLIPLVAGSTVGVWTVLLFASVGDGSPNPLIPPRHLVRQGPYRFSRNPMMVGGWLAGIGLGLVIGSPVYLAFCLFVMLAGGTYVVYIEEPRLHKRFGAPYADYCARTPRWIG